jgi:phosphatidylglycerol:prolipoprotein diacylglycerol transferase
MILAIIFLVLFAVATGISIYFTVNLVKTPMIEVDYKKFLIKPAVCAGLAVISFLVASFGFYQWLKATPDALHIVELILGSILFSGGLLTAINCFILHYYGRNIPEKLDRWFFRIQLISFVVAFFAFFIYTNGLAPYLSYPLVNGISFKEGLVTPNSSASPNLAFYALCILSGAILVYFICDHYMYKISGKHGMFESTFFVAFPAGIIGARIWYVIGNWGKEFAGEPFWHVFAVWEGGLTILGGAVMGIVVGVAWFVWRHKGKYIWDAIDLVLPCILIAQAIGRWGNFFNCEVHGYLVSDANWKWLPEIVLNNARYSSTSGFAPDGQIYVPLFFIEFISNLLGYFVLGHVFGKALRKHLEYGDVGAGYIIWYGMTRVLLEPLRDSSYQMGNNGYWSWVWSMIYVLVGTLMIIANHIIRNIIRKKKGELVVTPNDKNVGLIGSIVLAIVGGAILAGAIYLLTSNKFETVVAYNGFNIGLMLLVLGVSVLLGLAISLPIFFRSLNKEKEVVE